MLLFIHHIYTFNIFSISHSFNPFHILSRVILNKTTQCMYPIIWFLYNDMDCGRYTLGKTELILQCGTVNNTVCPLVHKLYLLVFIAMSQRYGLRLLASATLWILTVIETYCLALWRSCSFESAGLAPSNSPAVHRWGGWRVLRDSKIARHLKVRNRFKIRNVLLTSDKVCRIWSLFTFLIVEKKEGQVLLICA